MGKGKLVQQLSQPQAFQAGSAYKPRQLDTIKSRLPPCYYKCFHFYLFSNTKFNYQTCQKHLLKIVSEHEDKGEPPGYRPEAAEQAGAENHGPVPHHPARHQEVAREQEDQTSIKCQLNQR